MRRPIVALALALATSAVVVAQDRSLAQFSSQVQLVEVYATVNDDKGELVTGLRQGDFDVYENNQIQVVSAFAAGEFPLTVALGVDRSWSMAGKPLELAKQASRSFLNQLKPGDRSMVVAISSTADVIASLSTDRLTQSRAIAALDPWSTTALRDATIAALDRLESEPGRQALVPDLSDRLRQAAPAAACGACRAHRWTLVSVEGRYGIGKNPGHDCQGAAVSVPAGLRAIGSDRRGRARMADDPRHVEKPAPWVARACP